MVRQQTTLLFDSSAWGKHTKLHINLRAQLNKLKEGQRESIRVINMLFSTFLFSYSKGEPLKQNNEHVITILTQLKVIWMHVVI